MKKKKKILIGVLSLIILAAFTVLAISFSNAQNNIIDDYYKYVNGKELDKREIEKDKVGFSYLGDKQDEIDDEINKLTKEMIDNSENRNMNILYDSVRSNRRNSEGINPIRKYISRIETANDMNSLLEAVYEIDSELKLGLLMNPKISRDYKDSEKNLVYLYPLTVDFGLDIQMFSNPDYSSYRALISKYRIRLLKLYGYEEKEARNISNSINTMLDDIAASSKKTEDFNDVTTYYNVVSKDNLKFLYTNINVDRYLNSMKLSNVTKFSLVDSDNYSAMNKYLNYSRIDVLKNYFKVKIIESYAESLSDDYVQIIYGLNTEINGAGEAYNLDKYAIDITKSAFDDVISYKYAKENFTDKNRQDINKIIKEIITYYKKNIDSNEWLSKSTKDEAIKKLDSLKIRVGYPDELVFNSNNYNLNPNDSFFQNIVRINNYSYDYGIGLIDNKPSEEWPFSLSTINAFYNPQDNSINFPAALYKIMDDNNSDYKLLGSIGFTIAHEVTHAFDNSGRLFDEKGELNDWWTKEDIKEFDKRKNKIVDYYSEYKVSGINVDGLKTVGENIADLGAIKCITSIAEERGATKEEYKELYSAFANFFLSKNIDQYNRLLITMDVHSPNDVRVNATLSSNDKFYEVYNISGFDKMYKNKDDRVSIW